MKLIYPFTASHTHAVAKLGAVTNACTKIQNPSTKELKWMAVNC